MIASVVQPPVLETDPYLTAFCAPGGLEVFSAIVHANQIWNPDPFDVISIHAEAREAFARLVTRAVATPAPTSGKSLLLLGEAGSGKTHLIRAFRNGVQSEGTGYCGYLQMTTRSDNYHRYILSNLIDALSQPYCPPNPTSGLTRLASGLLDALDVFSADERQQLYGVGLEPADLADLVNRFSDVAIQDPRFHHIDLDLLRAVFYLLSEDGRIRARVLKWLRCEDLAPYDRDVLGGLVPRPQDHMPLRTIVDLGRLMAAVHGAALVLCVDQLEEMIDQSLREEDRGQLFRKIIDALIAVTNAIPTAVVVVACLEDYFKDAKQFLTKAKLDRLERDPEPIRLGSTRSQDEVEALVARRLEVLYDQVGLAPDPDRPTYPFRPEYLRPRAGLRTRDVLDWCRQQQERCMRAGRWVEPPPHEVPRSDGSNKPSASDALKLQQQWNDFLTNYQTPVLDEESDLANLLAWAVQSVSAELPDSIHFAADTEDRFVPVEMHGPGNAVEKLLVSICDKSSRGGGLGRQIDEVARRAGEIPAVIVRSSPFPKSAGAAVSKQIAQLIAPRGKGRRVEVENADWRAMAAFRDFASQHQRDAQFSDWQRQVRPLTELPGLCKILALDKVPRQPSVAPAETSRPASPRAEAPTTSPEPSSVPPVLDPLVLGETRAAVPTVVEVQPAELRQHAAFLGGSGSGKTTAALTLIEQLVMGGIPAVLIDRKGDLARYADPAAWNATDPDPTRAAKRKTLRDRIDVAVFTPGSAQGRPLALPIAPPDLGQLPEAEREQLCKYAATALAGMMGYRLKGIDPKIAILGKAIEVLAGLPGRQVTVRGLQKLIEDQDESLVLAVGGFDGRHYKKLAEDLLALSLQRQQLLEGQGETLDLDRLLCRGAHAIPGKVRLAVINTQFLGGPDAVEFWIAQFLITVGRWATRTASPEGKLQAVFLFDEADQYLPATRQPATKGPMENLLRRARSAGIGLFLATQSPGDFDYKCRDQIRLWLIGRVKEQVAITKLKPMLESGRVDAAAKLPGQATGNFYLVREGEVAPVAIERSLIETAQLPESRILELARTAAGLAHG
jgi:hypothetical protein